MSLAIMLVVGLSCVAGIDAALHGLSSTSTAQLANVVNSMPGVTWLAAPSRRFDGVPMETLRSMMGTTARDDAADDEVALPSLQLLFGTTTRAHAAIPERFDARTRWPQCTTIAAIRDQGSCGSCWAMAAAEVFSDRWCVATNASIEMSAQDLLTCCADCPPSGSGCVGGREDRAWRFIVQEGVVTGGRYGSGEGCRPYSIEPCEHDVRGPRPACFQRDATPKCVRKCAVASNKSYKADKRRAKSAYLLDNGVEAAQRDIIERGPVQAVMAVFADLLVYRSGVYHHVAGDYIGLHSVRVIGWGMEKAVNQSAAAAAAAAPYWLVANSWNSDWGDAGRFKIRRGVDECEIERAFIAGLPLVHD